MRAIRNASRLWEPSEIEISDARLMAVEWALGN